MEILKEELSVECDVDDTLVMWDNPFVPGEGKIRIECPYEEGAAFYLTPNRHHINILIAKKKRGNYVILHSQNGWAWAERVAKALNIEEYIDLVKTKTSCYIDDLPADSWKSRIYLADKKKT